MNCLFLTVHYQIKNIDFSCEDISNNSDNGDEIEFDEIFNDFDNGQVIFNELKNN